MPDSAARVVSHKSAVFFSFSIVFGYTSGPSKPGQDVFIGFVSVLSGPFVHVTQDLRPQ